MSYTYTDGNNNSYRITKNKLSYSPMTKEMSSSGTYSGGEPKKLDLTGQQFQEIKELLDAAFDNPKIHIKQRMMGSGSISRKIDDQYKRVMIRAFCEAQRAIDTYLKALVQ